MPESLKTLANNIVNLFNRSKFSISCCMTHINIKVLSPKKVRSPKKRKTIQFYYNGIFFYISVCNPLYKL